MGGAERRDQIMSILYRRRHETIDNLANEFGVSERTIRRDIERLSLSAPIYETHRDGSIVLTKPIRHDIITLGDDYVKTSSQNKHKRDIPYNVTWYKSTSNI